MKYILLVILVLVMFGTAGLAAGYNEVGVSRGAVMKGSVTFKGSLPADEITVIKKDEEVCGQDRKTGKYIINNSLVKNAVVWLEGVNQGKAIPNTAVPVTIKNCRVGSYVSVGFVGREFTFRNDDDILHTVQLKMGLAYQKKISSRPVKDGATIYNLALPLKGLEIQKPIKFYHRYSPDTGFIQVTSNTHTWMKGYIFIFEHPYAAVTDQEGAFVLEDIPAGEYVLKVWHEGLGILEKKVKVGSDETKEIVLGFSR